MINTLKELYRTFKHGEIILKLEEPSLKQKELTEELRNKTKNIPAIQTANLNGAALQWAEYMNELRNLILNEDPRVFLKWEVIQYSMFIGNVPYVDIELKDIEAASDFESRWKKAIQETKIGLPILYKKYLGSSANLIHHAYHIKKFEEVVQEKVSDIDMVFEFGGGYGSMYRLFKNLNFDNQYVIFDLPLFSLLQEYFIKSLGHPVLTIEEFCEGEKGLLCISDSADITKIMEYLPQNNKNLFIATWSISETSIELREKIMKEMDKINLFLIAYQKTFQEVDNIDYFQKIQEAKPTIDWKEWEISHVPISCYLMGKEK
jgi:hypothetical protein